MGSAKLVKKRKRDSADAEQSSKNSLASLMTLPPLVASVVEDDSALAPVVISTPGVSPPQDLWLNAYLKRRETRQEPSARSSTSGNNKGIASSEMLLQSSAHPTLDFLGRETEDTADAQLKHYLAIVDPDTQTWQFVEVRKLTLRGGVRKRTRRSASSDDDEVDDDTKTIRAQRTSLINTFGTKQARKAAQSQAENAQLSSVSAWPSHAAESAILSSMPDVAAAAASSQDTVDNAYDAASTQAQAAKPLPRANLAATHPADVYAVETLVPNGLSTLRQLPGVRAWRDAVLAGRGVTTSSRYVSNRVDAVVRSGNPTHLQILRFILLMLDFLRALRSVGKGAAGGASSSNTPGSKRLPAREDLRRLLSSATGGSTSTSINANANKQDHAHDPLDEQVPDSVLDAIRRRFAPQGSHMSKNEVTLVHTTLCALTLHIPPPSSRAGQTSGTAAAAAVELATDPADLRDDLRLDAQTVQHYFRELGCRYDRPRESEFARWNVRGGKAEANQRRIARLRLPLMFPKGGKGRGAGRR